MLHHVPATRAIISFHGVHIKCTIVMLLHDALITRTITTLHDVQITRTIVMSHDVQITRIRPRAFRAFTKINPRPIPRLIPRPAAQFRVAAPGIYIPTPIHNKCTIAIFRYKHACSSVNRDKKVRNLLLMCVRIRNKLPKKGKR